MTISRIFFASLCVAFFCGAPVGSQDSFFSGKTMRIVVGSSPGGGYDYWARLLARYMPRYIRGNPEVVVQNMPGGGSLVATNFTLWHSKDFDRHLVQTGRKRDERASDIPTVYELMDRYKTADLGRQLATVLTAGEHFG